MFAALESVLPDMDLSVVPDLRLPGGWPTAAAAGLATAGAILLYRSILPKPLPGIPYNEEALRTPLGDLPSIIRHVRRTRSYFGWFQEAIDRHQSPVIQVFFPFPFWRPSIVLSDAREVHDVLLRRTPRDFDRSHMMAGLVGGVAPEFHIVKKTGPGWKSNRRLLQDLMTPTFLRGVASGAIHGSAVDLIRLWEMKTGLAREMPFSVSEDVYHAALDAVLSFSFGEQFGAAGAIKSNVERLDEISSASEDYATDHLGSDGTVVFPEATKDPRIETMLYLASVIEQVRSSPIRKLKWWYLMRFTVKEPAAFKDKFLMDELRSARDRLQGQTDEKWVRSAVDHMVSREYRLAEKEGREPDYTSKVMLDEVFGFVTAGHETTSSTLLWALKILSDNPSAQGRIRAALRSALPAAHAEKRLPTGAEIHDTSIPYLDGAIEEVFRCGPTVPFNVRDTVRDTELMGHRVPRGTPVFLTHSGNGVLLPPYAVDDAARSETSRAWIASGKTPDWDVDNMADFVPERWLKDGEFDASSGMNLAFGTGTRGCYGRRLAYVEMRTLLTLILWRFELLRVEGELAGYEPIDGVTHKPQKCFVRLKLAY